jgi:predicted nucleic acid-binding protein
MNKGGPLKSLLKCYGKQADRHKWKSKFNRYLSVELHHQLLHDLNGAACWVDVPQDLAARTFCRDTADDDFIHAVLTTIAEWVVTEFQICLFLVAKGREDTQP